MAESETTVSLLSKEGRLEPTPSAEEFLPYFEKLTEADHRQFYADMIRIRAFDAEATNMQRQGQMALWPPSTGQEAAQVGSARASRPQDHIFPSYREHAVAMVRGIDLLGIIGLMRGTTQGGWDPRDANFHLYTFVIGSQALHATGYAMGVKFDGASGTGDPETDTAVMVYFGDGATSQGDVSEAMVFAASFQTPQVFFLQNNHWAISVPVSTQSRVPLYLRPRGFGLPSTQVDGNDVFASYAVTAKYLDDARSGRGPGFIEALTYRVGAHTTADDPTKYRTENELASWLERDPVARLEA
jgi:2-oxoisovalerate dehydrogenase E1 component alpha subunit